MRFLRLLVLLLFPVSVLATAFTATTTGNWNVNATWGGSGHPVSGDTATIPTGVAVTCNDAEAVGTSASSNTAIAITGTGQLLLTDGCVLSVKGSITLDAAGNTLKCTVSGTSAATLQFVVPATFNYTLSWSANGSANVFNWSGASLSLPCTITTTTGGGTAQFLVSSSPVGTVTTNNAVFSNLGTATTTGWEFNASNLTSISLTHTLWDNSGETLIPFFGSTIGYTFNALDWRRCLDTNNNYCMEITGSGNPAATRLITNMNAGSVSLSTTLWAANVSQPGVQIGESTIYGDPVNAEGFHGYNVWFNLGAANSSNIIVRNSIDDDDVWTGNRNFQVTGGGNQKYQDVIALMQGQNQHEIGVSTQANTTANTYQGVVCDGNGMVWTDTGNCIADSFNFTSKNNFCINEGGEWTAQGNTTASGSWLNDTSFNCNTVDVSQATAVTDFRNQLLIYPGWFGTGASNANGGYDESGFNQGDSAWPTGRLTGLVLDYNTFWMMPASGDSMMIGSVSQSARATCPSQLYCLLSNPAITGTPLGYIGVPSFSSATVQASTAIQATSTATVINCSACTFTTVTNGITLQAGDYLCDMTASPKTCAPITTVNSATQVTLVSPGISTLNGSTHTIQARAGYKSSASQFYGTTSGYGTHDLHVNPQFIDASRDSCTWFNAFSGLTSECNGYGSNQIANSFGMIFSVSSTPDTTHIVCSTCSFTTWGLIAGTTVVQDSINGGPTIRGRAVIQTIVDATHITLATAITGLAANDSFTFVTATQGIGRAIISTNGWDYGSGSSNGTNTPVVITPATWPTVQNEMVYLRQGFTPMNGQLKNTAKPSDCSGGDPLKCDPGAVPVYPATAMVAQ